MFLRYLILFGGIVIMITGCNSLVSQNFGTHRLRTMPANEATVVGIGDADFVEVTGVDLGQPQLSAPTDDLEDGLYVYRPLLNARQLAAWDSGTVVSVSLIGWFKSTDPACKGPEPCLPHTGKRVIGLVNEPAARKNPVGEWASQRISLAEPVVYLELGQEPMAWYCNLGMFLGGALLAFLPEARRFREKSLPT